MTLRHFLAVLVGLCSLAAVATPSAAQSVVSVTQYNYDEHNRPICTAVRMNPAVFAAIGSTDACTLGTQSGVNGPDRITRNSYDAAGQLIQVDQAYGTSVQRAYARYTYTANGQKATEKDANGNLTTLEYDGFDRLSKLRYPSITVGSGTSSTTDFEFFDYDPNGNRTHWRRRDGQVIKDCFDKLNRLTVHYLHSQSGCTATGGAKDVYTSYDLTGKILSKRFASFSGSGVTYAYDGLGRVTSTTDMNSRTVAYQYNVAGARTRLQFPDGINIDYALDNTSRVKSLGWNASSGAYSRDYNSLGQLTAETKGGGSVSYAYDGVGRLTSFTNNLSGTASDIAWTFGYNPAGQVMVSDASSTLYNYEELTGITEPAQSHDGLNRVSTLVLPTGACPSGGYDARGNLICDGAGRSYAYDIENRLLTGNVAGNSLVLTYDPEGRLASYSWNGGAVSFLYDGVNLIGEYNNSNQMLRRYIHGPGTDNPVVWYEGAGNGTRRYFYTNQQGSVITTADASGNRGDIYAYGAYGEPKDQAGFTYWPSIGTGATSVSRFGYTGQMFLADARLYYYKARIYDPQMGRFLQTDPIGSEDDLNLYGYVGGDPVNNADPDGRQSAGIGANGGPALNPQLIPFNGRNVNMNVNVPLGTEPSAGSAYIAAPLPTPFASGAAIFKAPGSLVTAADASAANLAVAQSTADTQCSTDPNLAAAERQVRAAWRTQPGSYTNTFESGTTYDGQGSRMRSQRSAAETTARTGDRHVATDWTPSPTRRDGFKDESRRMESNPGPVHNRRRSPGDNYRMQDGD